MQREAVAGGTQLHTGHLHQKLEVAGCPFPGAFRGSTALVTP